MSSPVRYYFDQNMTAAVAAGLRNRGVDVLTAQDAGRCGYADPDQLAFATAAGRVIVTFDVDYLSLHATGVPHTGIVWAPARKYTIGQLIGELEDLTKVYAADDMIDRLEHL